MSSCHSAWCICMLHDNHDKVMYLAIYIGIEIGGGGIGGGGPQL